MSTHVRPPLWIGFDMLCVDAPLIALVWQALIARRYFADRVLDVRPRLAYSSLLRRLGVIFIGSRVWIWLLVLPIRGAICGKLNWLEAIVFSAVCFCALADAVLLTSLLRQ